MPRQDPPKVKDLKAGMKVPAYVHACANCAELFLARKDARFCSNACRMAAARKKQG
jgi:hypothetical protein